MATPTSNPESDPTPPPSVHEDVPSLRSEQTRYAPEKPVYTTQDMDIWVAPDGDDDALGTKSEPIASLAETDRRIPLLNRHRVTVHMLPGTHDNDEAPFLGPYYGHFVKRTGVKFVGEGSQPDDVKLKPTGAPGHVSVSGVGLNPLCLVRLDNLSFYCQVQVYGTAFLTNCVLRNPANPTNEARHNRGLAGYNNFVRVQESVFEENPAETALSMEYGIACKDGATYHMANNTFEVETAAVKFYGGGGHVVPFGGNDVSTPEHGWQIEGDKPEPL